MVALIIKSYDPTLNIALILDPTKSEPFVNGSTYIQEGGSSTVRYCVHLDGVEKVIKE